MAENEAYPWARSFLQNIDDGFREGAEAREAEASKQEMERVARDAAQEKLKLESDQARERAKQERERALPELLRAGSTLNTVFVIGGWVGSIAGAYHGYKRNDSVGWAIGWSLLGAFWPVTIPIMVAQGFGKPIAKAATANGRKARKKTSK